MTTNPVDKRRPTPLPGGVTGYAGQPVTWNSSRRPMTRRSQAGSGQRRRPTFVDGICRHDRLLTIRLLNSRSLL